MRHLLLVTAVLFFGFRASADAFPSAKAEEVGMSSTGLARLHQGMGGWVERNELGGYVSLVVRQGKVVDVEVRGVRDAGKDEPLRADALFRVASMTKPVTSVAALILMEEGKLLLSDPISRWLPGFKNPKVIAPGPAGGGAVVKTVPAEREITVRDLLTHRSGLVYGFLDHGPAGQAYARAGIVDLFPAADLPQAENVDRLAALPLAFSPGKEWRYGLSSDVLGRLVEVVSGKSLDAFLEERIFGPLKMKDTAFFVPEGKLPRLAALHVEVKGGGQRVTKDGEKFRGTLLGVDASLRPGHKYLSGGAGLVSTAADFARFAEMLLEGGQLGGVRILSRKTVELMTTSHTRDLPHGLEDDGTDFGLGVSVTMDVGATQKPGSPGSFGWAGLFGTSFFVDPREKLVGVFMTQQLSDNPRSPAEMYQTLVEAAVVK
jgi:CubicO group peptidase (beta-lactamase class C family)